MSKPLMLFSPTLPLLSKNEKEVLSLLMEAGKLVAPIYERQENRKHSGANFYPHDISTEELVRAAKKNPQILSPYTVVEKRGKVLVAVPYHQKYADLLIPIAEKLRQAARVTDNKEFSKRLKKQADALINGNYEEAQLYWMSMKPYILDINIGPVERYDDKLFFTKTSYQAWIGIMDESSTRKANTYKDIILSARRESMMPSEKVDYYEKVQIRVDSVLLFSGLIARTMFLGVNLPNSPELMEKYGSEITIFRQVGEYRLQHEVWPAFKKIFSPSFQKIFTSQDIKEGVLYSTILHELAHTYLRYRHSENRLQDLFPIIDELSAYVLGMKVGGSLLLRDIISQQQLESVMVAFIARSFGLVFNETENGSKIHYTLGGAIFINYMLETGALKEVRGLSWPNFVKMFVSLDQLSHLLEKLLSQGTRSDAEVFIKKYGNIKTLQKFK